MCLSAIPGVDIHTQAVKLLQTCHCVEKHDNKTTTLDSLDSTTKHIGSYALEVLKDAHAECLTQDLVRVLVIAVSDVLRGEE